MLITREDCDGALMSVIEEMQLRCTIDAHWHEMRFWKHNRQDFGEFFVHAFTILYPAP